MKVCGFPPADYQKQGYVHVHGRMAADFHDDLRGFVGDLAEHRLAGPAGVGNKDIKSYGADANPNPTAAHKDAPDPVDSAAINGATTMGDLLRAIAAGGGAGDAHSDLLELARLGAPDVVAR